MREILFRGKRKEMGEWIYGWLGHLHSYNPQAKSISSIYFTEITEDYESRSNIIVDYKTVGQYTGLTDKNGKKIFEGDICKHRSNYSGDFVISIVTYTDGQFLSMVNENSGFNLSDKLEVIGNIHDNPELLKGGEG